MGGGRKRRKQSKGTGFESQAPVEAVGRSIALHPSESILIVSVGDKLRGYNFGTQQTFLIQGVGQAKVRAIEFSPCGLWFVAGCQDKSFKLWKVGSWDGCAQIFKAQKRISAVTFTPDGKYCVACDKFGDVYCGQIDVGVEESHPSLLLGHYCSVITSVSIPQDGATVVTTDRDSKVRVSVMPKDPMNGAHEIQSYCMGHTSFVTTSCFAGWGAASPVLVTGGGDGRVIVWNHMTGHMLCSYQIPPKQMEGGVGGMPQDGKPGFDDDDDDDDDDGDGDGDDNIEAGGMEDEDMQQEAKGMSAEEVDEGDDDSGTREIAGRNESGEKMDQCDAAAGAPADAPADADTAADAAGASQWMGNRPEHSTHGNVVLAMSAACKRPYIAVVIEGQQSVLILECDISNWALVPHQELVMPKVAQPSCVSFDKDDRLWLVGGPPAIESEEVHVGLAESNESSLHFSSCIEQHPQSEIDMLEGRSQHSQVEDTSRCAASVSQILGKREYKDLEFRKRYRAQEK